jgi:uncharacterized protein
MLIVMARWPAPGRCKSRLAAGLGRARAAAVQQRLQAHGLAAARLACGPLGCSLRLALAGVGPQAARRQARHWGLGAAAVVLQGSGGLGLRLQRQLARAFSQGWQQVVLVGSDLPQLAPTDLHAAFAALAAAPLVLGPAVDGGYWLVGLRTPAAGLFCGIDWGTASVLDQTLARARQLQLPAALLRQQADLDRPLDLAPWRSAGLL